MAETVRFRTVARLGKAELAIKGSRFIAQAFPVSSVEEAEETIHGVKVHYCDATHNCSAYRVGYGAQAVYRFDDDGEPAGTAGRPILQAIEGKGLTDVAVVVTRYFGGIKLGAGGLVRAYSAAASAALEDAGPIEKSPQVEVSVQVPYAYYDLVQQVVREQGGTIVRSQFAERVSLLVTVPAESRDKLLNKLVDVTAGRIRIRE
ncbi:MAG: YigZ family protein [candidate division KSB1 bacterium]|nr:YigZ family protein [candidate division KSB1 bacterium]